MVGYHTTISFFRSVAMIPILVVASALNAQAFDMFGIDILAANRNQIAEAILQNGARQLPSGNPLTDRYESLHLFPGARVFVGFTVDEAFENIVCQFDSGSIFTEVLKFDELKQLMIATYGEPVITPDEHRDSNFEEELRWRKDGISIQLISYKWFAAWRVHVTHRLCFYRVANGAQQGS